MIEAISIWVKEIVFIVLFAAFLELLLPNGGMQKFVRVIMGLLIMMAVLNPVIELLEDKTSGRDAAVFGAARGGDYQTVGIVDAADAARKKREQLAKEYYAKELARQIRATVMSVGGVGDAEVMVSLKEDTSRESENPRARTPVPPVARVIILAEAANASPTAIKTVKIAVGTPTAGQSPGEKAQVPEKTALSPSVIEKISRVISELYHINSENIEVRPSTGGNG